MTPPVVPLPVGDEERRRRTGHDGAVVWITGLSGAGKTTLALATERALFERGCGVFPERSENIRRIGEVARLFYEAGQIVIVSAISPLRADRARARALIPAPYFIEVHCRCPLAVCEARDPKGLYRKARAGLLPEFTGISSPYEAPDAPELVVDSATTSVEDEVARLVDVLARRGLLDPRG
jgi:adenylylsulfate kinase-like enzyme